jgi:hypothetical protein
MRSWILVEARAKSTSLGALFCDWRPRSTTHKLYSFDQVT